MPIYEYRPRGIQHCSHCSKGFDLLEKISAAPITQCPQCGASVQRIISAPNLGRPGPSLKTENLEKHGFTQYRKSRKGEYHKTAGTGPDVISNE